MAQIVHMVCEGCRDGILNQQAHYGYGGCLYDPSDDEFCCDLKIMSDQSDDDEAQVQTKPQQTAQTPTKHKQVVQQVQQVQQEVQLQVEQQKKERLNALLIEKQELIDKLEKINQMIANFTNGIYNGV